MKIPYVTIACRTPNKLNISPSWEDGWQIWNDIRTYTGNSSRLFVALDLSFIPWDSSIWDDKSISTAYLVKWSAEPVKAVIINTKSFKVGKQKSKMSRNVLTLPAVLQTILVYLFKYNIHVIISGRPPLSIEIRRY